jgi:hypothetical protein
MADRSDRTRGRRAAAAPDDGVLENAPSSSDGPDSVSAPEVIAAAWGDRADGPAVETVDGDYNGAPELAGLDESRDWEAADVLDAMEGAEAGQQRDEPPLAVRLEEQVEERRLVLLERMAEAEAVGLGTIFAVAAAESAPDEGGAPLVADESVLRDRLTQIDRALELLESSPAPAERAAPVARRPEPGPLATVRGRRVAPRASASGGPFVRLLLALAAGAVAWAWASRHAGPRGGRPASRAS